ncbi:MAG: type II secretion system protein [Thermodesulfobacteriota bacterium]|nr:type II secretion system protein [Thermodesulfobacteriota bacterium]
MNSGLTFIEIVVVLGIIGVLAAVATVRFTSTSTISVRASADMIQSDIRYTQTQAMTVNAPKSINFIAGSDSYMVDSDTRELPSGVTISVGRLYTFNSLGEPTAGGGQSVSVSDGTNTKTITVIDYTGKVTIKDLKAIVKPLPVKPIPIAP